MTTRDFSTRPARRSSLLDRALVVAALAGLAAAAVATLAARRALREASQAVADVRDDPASRRMLPRGRRSSEREALAAQALATSAAPPARVFAELASLMPSDVRLNGATLSYDEAVGLELTVSAREDASYDRFLERLAASPRFSDILPGSEARGGALSAPIRMRYRIEGMP
jgi:type II secretory pathway component PulL